MGAQRRLELNIARLVEGADEIAGIRDGSLDGRPVEESTLRKMMQTIVHRGPDDAGVAIDGGVGLAFRRLSILDLSPQGHQPMDSPDGRHTIVFNEEFLELVDH